MELGETCMSARLGTVLHRCLVITESLVCSICHFRFSQIRSLISQRHARYLICKGNYDFVRGNQKTVGHLLTGHSKFEMKKLSSPEWYRLSQV